MTAYLKRLVSSLAAYQVADVVSKFIAVILLPVYTRFVTPAGYGVVELLANGVILVSILVRFGIIEAFLRFYFTDDDQDRRDALARRSILFLLARHHDRLDRPGGVRRARSAGWCSDIATPRRCASPSSACGRSPTWSWPTALLRVEERLRLYAVASVSNVLMTVAASVVLVVIARQGRPRAAAGQLRRLDRGAVRAVVQAAPPAASAARARRARCASCCASGCPPSPPRPRSTR